MLTQRIYTRSFVFSQLFVSIRIFASSRDLFPFRNYALGLEVISSQSGIVNLQDDLRVVNSGSKDLETVRVHC